MLLLRVVSVPTRCFITSRNVLTVREDRASRDETKHMRHVRSINFGRQRANFSRIISHKNKRINRSQKNNKRKLKSVKEKK